jgi:hypothetical protein
LEQVTKADGNKEWGGSGVKKTTSRVDFSGNSLLPFSSWVADRYEELIREEMHVCVAKDLRRGTFAGQMWFKEQDSPVSL